MDVLEHIVRLASMDVPPHEMLQAAAREIAADLYADSCRIFLRGHVGGLLLRASFGEVDDGERSRVAERLASEAAAGVSLTAAETPSASWLSVPLVSRVRCLGAIVIERSTPAALFSEDEVARLSAIAPQMVDLVEGASLIEVIDGVVDEAPEVVEVPNGERVLDGTAASPGIAIGIVAFRHAFPSELARQASSRGEQLELESSRDAFQKTKNDLLRMQSAAASELGEDEALVFARTSCFCTTRYCSPVSRKESEVAIRQSLQSTTPSKRSDSGYETSPIPTFKKRSRTSRISGVGSSVIYSKWKRRRRSVPTSS